MQSNMFDLSNPEVREKNGYQPGSEFRPLVSIHWKEELIFRNLFEGERRKGMTLEAAAEHGARMGLQALPLPVGYRIIIVNENNEECVELMSNR